MGTHCTDARLYRLQIKIGTRTKSAMEPLIVELASGVCVCVCVNRDKLK